MYIIVDDCLKYLVYCSQTESRGWYIAATAVVLSIVLL